MKRPDYPRMQVECSPDCLKCPCVIDKPTELLTRRERFLARFWWRKPTGKVEWLNGYRRVTLTTEQP